MPIDYYAFELFTRSAEAIARSSFNLMLGGVSTFGLLVLRDIALAAPRKPVESVEPERRPIINDWANQPAQMVEVREYHAWGGVSALRRVYPAGVTVDTIHAVGDWLRRGNPFSRESLCGRSQGRPLTASQYAALSEWLLRNGDQWAVRLPQGGISLQRLARLLFGM